MGGLAFAHSGPNRTPLHVPRMPPDVYQKVAREIQTKLCLIFQNVTIPRDAPGKRDFGDIDFLVEGALCPWTPASIQEAIGGAYLISHGGTQSYAVPYADNPDQYVQVDVEISPGNGTQDSAELFQWTRFMKSDSDLMQIVGICHRSLGLTCNDRGLHVRVEEIEPYDKKKSLLYLTRDPNQAIGFLGLDTTQYWAGWRNEEDLFAWVSEGRFFDRQIFDGRIEKANDRSRQRKRPMYNRFIEEYMPSHPEAGKQHKAWTRQEVLEEALEAFDKRAEYEEMMKEHDLRVRDIAIWERVKESLPLEGNSLSLTLKGLRRWVKFDNGIPFIATEPVIDNQPSWALAITNEKGVISWISENWEEVKALEKARASAAKEAGKSKINII